MKTEERKCARRLRFEEGLPIKEIARRVGVSVSSVSVWVRDIELAPAQHAVLLAKNPAHNKLLSGRHIAASNRRRERIAYQNDGRLAARRAEALHRTGCMLYWAEGGKNRNQVRFSNSDPEMAKLFVAFLRRYFDLAPQQIRVTCNLFADHLERQREIEQFWLTSLRLPQESLCKSVV